MGLLLLLSLGILLILVIKIHWRYKVLLWVFILWHNVYLRLVFLTFLSILIWLYILLRSFLKWILILEKDLRLFDLNVVIFMFFRLLLFLLNLLLLLNPFLTIIYFYWLKIWHNHTLQYLISLSLPYWIYIHSRHHLSYFLLLNCFFFFIELLINFRNININVFWFNIFL